MMYRHILVLTFSILLQGDFQKPVTVLILAMYDVTVLRELFRKPTVFFQIYVYPKIQAHLHVKKKRKEKRYSSG